jgi:hemerythrin
MAKRLSDTDKWKFEDFRLLPPKMKLAWLYMVDNCDHAGIWTIDMGLMSFQIGDKITLEELLQSFPSDLIQLGAHLFMPKFIIEQYKGYKKLNPANKVHASVINRLKEFNYNDLEKTFEGATKPQASPLLGSKDKDKDKVKVKRGTRGKAKAEADRSHGTQLFNAMNEVRLKKHGATEPRDGKISAEMKRIVDHWTGPNAQPRLTLEQLLSLVPKYFELNEQGLKDAQYPTLWLGRNIHKLVKKIEQQKPPREVLTPEENAALALQTFKDNGF